MRLIFFFLALVQHVVGRLEPETLPKPSVKGFSTITGICDPSVGAIAGAKFTGQSGTLKECSNNCAENPNCKGLNFVVDQNVCQLFEQECENARILSKSEPLQNFYLKGEIACASSTLGQEFYIAFMSNRVAKPQNRSLELWLTQDKSNEEVTVTLETDPSKGMEQTIVVPYKQAVSALIPATWKMTDVDAGVQIEKKALRLRSDVEFVFYGVNKEFFTADAFLGIPTRALGIRYIASCHWPPFYNCEFAFTPANDDTTIRVTLPRGATRNSGNWAKPPTQQSICKLPYKDQIFTNGETLEIKLNVFEVAQIQDPCDLTGAIIESDKPIAFWSGDSRVNIGDAPSRDHQVEALFSTDTWGTECAAWPTPNRAPGLVDYWTLNAAEDGTVIRVDSNEVAEITYELNAGESVRFPSNSVNEWKRFSSNKRFQAVQYAHSAVDNTIPGDPAMTTCIPSDQFGFGYTFVTPSGVSSPYTNFLTVITKAGGEEEFELDGEQVTGVTWNPIPGSDLVGGVVRLNSDKLQFRIEHRVRGTTFEAYIYGSGDRESIAYPTGACIKALGECSKTTMFVADGKDNDCDGVIDEELCDGIDNDYDGQVDEDCYRKKPASGDRCPAVQTAQACIDGAIHLECESGSIKVIEGHFGRIGKESEFTCNSANVFDQCSQSQVDCGWVDISETVSIPCEGQAKCSLPVNQFRSKGRCPSCSLYAQVHYVCLLKNELEHGALTGRDRVGSSWLRSFNVQSSCEKVEIYQGDQHHYSKSNFGVGALEGWRPSECDKSTSWLELDLISTHAIGWYAISGCRRTEYWTETFHLSYSVDGKSWDFVTDPTSGEKKVFEANSNAITPTVCTLFSYNIVARYLRVHPVAYHSSPCIHINFGHAREAKLCPMVTVANSNLAKGGISGYGSSATVRCDHDWATPSGRTSYSVQCETGGTWASNFEDCSKALGCPDIPQIEGGFAIGPGNHINAKIKYECEIGWRLIGPEAITCESNGQWSEKAPVCEQL